MSTMKHFIFILWIIQLVCVLLLSACATGAASEDYRRTMWVSTTGVDSPQCIHDTPASDPAPYPHHSNETCGSLKYAFIHMKNYTIIAVLCGIHELKPLKYSPDCPPLSNIRSLSLAGECSKELPQIYCINGANLKFYNVQSVGIAQLAFKNCSEQLRHSDSISNSSVLYFQDCTTIMIAYLNITITGPYGRGISIITSDRADGVVRIGIIFVSIYHFGSHGSGIHCEISTGKTTGILSPIKELQMIQRNIQIFNANVHPDKHLAKAFTGINITVRGDGEGGVIFLSNITVSRNTSGTGISLTLLDKVSGFDIRLRNLHVRERLENSNLYNSTSWEETCTVNDVVFHDFSSNITKNAGKQLTEHSSIQIELKDNSFGNQILIRGVWVVDRIGITPGNAFSIEVTDHSVKNTIQLQEVRLLQLAGSSNTSASRRGLQVVLTGMARSNNISVGDLLSSHYRAYLGGGAYVEFSGNATRNMVILANNHFHANCAVKGGGMAIMCKDFAAQNVFQGSRANVNSSLAELGGGLYLNMQDSSSINTIIFTGIELLNNTALCGGGIFIYFQDAAEANKVVTSVAFIINNTLLPSQKYDMMGGGVHVEFSTVSATFRTNNIVNFKMCKILFNAAEQGVGGGVSVLYKHSHYKGDSGDSVSLDALVVPENKAASGSAFAFQSVPTHGKRLFRGIRVTHTVALMTYSKFQTVDYRQLLTSLDDGKSEAAFHNIFPRAQTLISEQKSQTINPFFQVQTNTNLIFVKSVQLTIEHLVIFCGASSQGIYALDSGIIFQANTWSYITLCVATHGGAIALYGESYIRVNTNAGLLLLLNHAFQRGGAIYASSAPAAVPVSSCFIHDYQSKKQNAGGFFALVDNSAKAKGQAVYVSDIRNCFPKSMGMVNKNILQSNFTYNCDKDQSCNGSRSRLTLKQEIMSGPSHVAGALVNMNRPLTIRFIPGKQKKLPYTHAYDEFGNNISSVFTVLISKIDDFIPMELDPFSKFTTDFIVILHGTPQQHGMVHYSSSRQTNTTSADVRPPQLVLQSLDNKDLLLVMNLELQCCPPGYVFQYGSGDMGTCHCGVLTMTGIAECNESHPEAIGAVLERDHWAEYLPSNDKHSCDGQRFFTGACPPGYCISQPITLPQNNSQKVLQDSVCAESNRKGLLCGDCMEGKGIALNFNGIRPVCISCEEELSKVGILVWILSEWVPMLVFMFVLMLFNIDLVSGRFNSFLLFAQLLAFSTIRGDAELGPVHNAFVRLYRFLYGMWNLDFFGVLLPPFCLTPHAHLTLLQTLLLHYSIGLFPLTVAITLTVLERSAEKWICCHRVDQGLRRMRRWKAKYSDGMSYDRALPAFIILGFTRFLVSSSYFLVNQTITGEDGEEKVVVWWQGSVPYGSIQHIAYLIPAIVILLVFVLLPSFLLLTLPIVPQLFGRLIIAVPPLRKLQRIQTFCSNVYTDRWVYHFINVFQGCYKERFRSFSSFYLFQRIVYLLVAAFIPRVEDVLRIQIFLTVALLLLIAFCQPYNSLKLNTLDSAILGNLTLILILNSLTTDLSTPIGTRQFYASIQMILIHLPLLYPGILLGRKVYLKCRQLGCCQEQEEQMEDYAEPLLEPPAARLGNLVLITELHAGVPTSEVDDTATETETET